MAHLFYICLKLCKAEIICKKLNYVFEQLNWIASGAVIQQINPVKIPENFDILVA